MTAIATIASKLDVTMSTAEAIYETAEEMIGSEGPETGPDT